VVEAIKYELKKYIKRERNKKRPEEVDFWDFDCRYGANEASCGVIHVSEINKVISEADAEGLNSFFLEVLSRYAFQSSTHANSLSVFFIRPRLSCPDK
jgi:hypothetical protein